jgi:predicted DNA-binding protein YlxM (UPF0122 family)
MPSIASDYGVTRSAVQGAIRSVERHLANAREVLAAEAASKRVGYGTIEETFIAPPHVIRKLRELYRSLMSA